MKIAMPVWNGRVSPVFDTAGRALIVEVKGQRVIRQDEQTLPEPPTASLGWPHAADRGAALKALGVEVLICGAISRPMALALEQAGITVRAWTAGPVHEVLDAYLRDGLSAECFLMPGCRGRGRRVRCRRRGGGRRA